MKVHELIEQLQSLPRSATVYVLTTDTEISPAPILKAVESVSPAKSEVFGSAVIIEMED